jgi:hypothetical protein
MQRASPLEAGAAQHNCDNRADFRNWLQQQDSRIQKVCLQLGYMQQTMAGQPAI